MDEYTQLSEDEIESYQKRESNRRQEEAERLKREAAKKREFRWSGGMC